MHATIRTAHFSTLTLRAKLRIVHGMIEDSVAMDPIADTGTLDVLCVSTTSLDFVLMDPAVNTSSEFLLVLFISTLFSLIP